MKPKLKFTSKSIFRVKAVNMWRYVENSVKETDVAKPIEKYLEDLGYLVHSEVNDCDITATKEDELLVVECKTSISLKLIYQALDRQEFSDSVYIAVPLPHGKSIPNRKHLMRLLKRLEMGLILVHFLKTKTRVEIILDPREYRRMRKLKKRTSILEEIKNRSENFNTGGTRGKIMTAYKESALEIAKLLLENGSLSAKDLCKRGTVSKTHSILYKNFYGWFNKGEKRGQYVLSSNGVKFVKTYSTTDLKN